MEHSERIRFEDGFTAGKPRLARPALLDRAGAGLVAERQSPDAVRRRRARRQLVRRFLDALIKPHQSDNRSDALGQDQEFGNQIAAWTSRFIFPGRTPFAAYLEYAGEDSSYEGNYRLGNAALSVGITFPRLWRRFDLTYEASEWQNGWYAHGIYLDGMTNDGHVLGHWGADRRVFARRRRRADPHAAARLGSRRSAAFCSCRRARSPTKATAPTTTSAATTWR